MHGSSCSGYSQWLSSAFWTTPLHQYGQQIFVGLGEKIMSHINNWSITKINAFWVQNVIYEKRIVLKITISLTINPYLLKYAKHYIFVKKIIVEIQFFFLQDCPWDIQIKNINPRSSRKKPTRHQIYMERQFDSLIMLLKLRYRV